MGRTGIEIKPGDFSGVRITLRRALEHVVLQATFESFQSDDRVSLSIRVFNNTTTASATIGDTGYKANPETVRSNVATNTIDQTIVTAKE